MLCCMNKPQLFYFFPLASIGGTESVHADVLEALKDYPSETYIRYRTNVWKGKEYAQSRTAYQEGVAMLPIYKLHSNVTFVSKWLESPRLGRMIRYFFMKNLIRKINKENTLVIFWHRESIEFLWPYIKDHVPIIDIVHNNSNNNYPDAQYLLKDWSSRINQRILVSEGLKSLFHELYLDLENKTQLLKRLTTIPHCVDFPKEGYLDKNNDKLKVLFIGRDSAEKRFNLILQIVRIVADKNLPIEFHIIGPEPSRFSAHELPNILWYGSLKNRNQINEIYRLMDVVLLSSSSEGFPKVLAEAMAFSVIPIATKVGDIPMHIETNVNGFITAVNTCVHESILHLSNLYKDPNLRSRLRENTYEYAAKNFRKERFQNDWKRIISTPS